MDRGIGGRLAAMDATIETRPGVYYFTVPCSASSLNGDGDHVPKRTQMGGMFRETPRLMGANTGTTAGGVVIDDSWRENDGLVTRSPPLRPSARRLRSMTPGTSSPALGTQRPCSGAISCPASAA